MCLQHSLCFRALWANKGGHPVAGDFHIPFATTQQHRRIRDHIWGGPKKVRHYQVSSLNRIKTVIKAKFFYLF